MSKPRFATVWLDGCSGCHMSFLDIDERLMDLAEKVEVVYSPLVDLKEYPERVDIALVEGAVASEEDERKIRHIRERTKTLVSLGDCAVTGNVPSMRNAFGLKAVFERGYFENATIRGEGIPREVVPALLPQVRPVHETVEVDVFVPGCPPAADVIYFVIGELLEGRKPDLSTLSRFGA
jgi:NAD-reducing hydrogenase small subunit